MWTRLIIYLQEIGLLREDKFQILWEYTYLVDSEDWAGHEKFDVGEGFASIWWGLSIEEKLNWMGARGWELVNMYHHTPNKFYSELLHTDPHLESKLEVREAEIADAKRLNPPKALLKCPYHICPKCLNRVVLGTNCYHCYKKSQIPLS